MPMYRSNNAVAEEADCQTIGNTRSPHWIKYRIDGTREVSWIALNKEMKDRERDDRRCHKTTHP